MKKRILLNLGLAGLLPCVGFASWQVIDDFDDENMDGWNWVSEDGPPPSYIFSDDPKGGKALYVESGNIGVAWASKWIHFPIPDGGIAPGTSATIFLRYLEFGPGNQFAWGTADADQEVDVDGVYIRPGGWSDYNALAGMNSGVGAFRHYDGGSYVGTEPAYTFQSSQWYKFWMHVENVFDSDGVSQGTYTIYVQGPDDDAPQILPVGTEPAKDKAFFRRSPINEDGSPRSLTWLMIATNSGPPASPWAGDPWLVDDFSVDLTGLNLTDPDAGPAAGWAGYPYSNGMMDVNTGSWMGWVNAANAPYIYNYNLGKYIYIPEPVGEDGSWVYVFE